MFRKFYDYRIARAAEADRRSRLSEATLTVYFVRPGEITSRDEHEGFAVAEPERTAGLAELVASDHAVSERKLLMQVDRSEGFERRMSTARVLADRLGVPTKDITSAGLEDILAFRHDSFVTAERSRRLADFALDATDLVIVTMAPTIAHISGQRSSEIVAASATRIDYRFGPSGTSLVAADEPRTLMVPRRAVH